MYCFSLASDCPPFFFLKYDYVLHLSIFQTSKFFLPIIIVLLFHTSFLPECRRWAAAQLNFETAWSLRETAIFVPSASVASLSGLLFGLHKGAGLNNQVQILDITWDSITDNNSAIGTSSAGKVSLIILSSSWRVFLRVTGFSRRLVKYSKIISETRSSDAIISSLESVKVLSPWSYFASFRFFVQQNYIKDSVGPIRKTR